jgi:hypothetical protein
MYRPSMYKPLAPLRGHKYQLLGGGSHVEPAQASTESQASEIRASAETSDCPTWRSTPLALRKHPDSTLHQGGDFMPLNKARTLRNSKRPKKTLSVNSSDEVVWAKVVAHEPSRSVSSIAVADVDEAPRRARSDAIEDQCARLVNMLGAVHCMSIGIVTPSEHPAPELCVAFTLLEREILSIAGCLKEIALRAQMPGIEVCDTDKSDAGTPVINYPATDLHVP